MRILAWFAGLIGLIIIIVLIGVAAGWFAGEASLRSFPHVKETYRQAYDDVNSMDANARQACRVEKASEAAPEATKIQRETQLLAIENNYDRVKGEYEAYMNDHFRGKIIHPRDLPLPFPALENRMPEVCR